MDVAWGAQAGIFMKGRLYCENSLYKIWTANNLKNTVATQLTGSFSTSWKWNTWALSRLLFKLPRVVQGGVIVTNCSRYEGDSVSQTQTEGKCWHSESVTIWV